MDENGVALGVLPGAGRNQSLARAFDLLERIAAHPDGASVATLTHEVGLPRATVSRLLASLADAGAVIREPGGRAWSLGPTILRLSRAIAPVELRDRARPLLQALVEATQETVFLAVPTGAASARVVEELQAPRVIAARGWNDEELTTPASGFVRLVLAHLPPAELENLARSMQFTPWTPNTITTPQELIHAVEKCRRDGYSVVVDELEEGLAGMAVPVHTTGSLSAMIAIYMPTARFTEAMQQRALKLLRETASRLST
jgi:IclR family acetate operon transcriptional repressor